ncbi:MAG: hypothetical protein MUF10_00775 [Thermoanaerobaculaceae bacterium]|jgi:hypothetical protein|nr:hypothetical protein [Thermoanaerobaculaceae bacterium]
MTPRTLVATPTLFLLLSMGAAAQEWPAANTCGGSSTALPFTDLGSTGAYPVFDGTNIWVPSVPGNSIIVVRAATATVLATLTGNGLAGPKQVAFDGERMLAVNTTGNSVSLWNSADLRVIGTFSTGADFSPNGVCSDGLNFWISLDRPGVSGYLGRY